jgi:hypothetical protein
VRVETDAAAERELEAEVQLLPENCEGAAYKAVEKVRLPKGRGELTFTVAAPGAKWWWPAEPNLYRCRVILRDGDKLVDAKDALFGFRSFGMVSKSHPMAGQPDGRFVLNGRPVFLRGSNITGAYNAYWYWNEPENLLTASLMLKAANFNAVRSCQHIGFPEVRELFDRLGIMSEQDLGHGSEIGDDTSATVAEMGTTLARICYNNPGVVLLTFANEIHTPFNAAPVATNVLAVDPERIIKPVSGQYCRFDDPKQRDNLVSDDHSYAPWYGGGGVENLWDSAQHSQPRECLKTLGEYGGEALDAYETMRDHYPKHWPPVPPPEADELRGARQVAKADLRQQFGFRGVVPTNLVQYIEASQTYQADLLAEMTKGFRLSRQSISGYFQFHFLDGTPARWPKAIVSHDFRPKKGYYEMAQINQPLVPLYRLAGRGSALELWVVNDLPQSLEKGRLRWEIQGGNRRLDGSMEVAVPAGAAVRATVLDLFKVPAAATLLDVRLKLADAQGRLLAEYGREIYRDFRLVDWAREDLRVKEVRKVTRDKLNLALNKPIAATSAEVKSPADNAVDGKIETAWQSALGYKTPQALTVDLGAVVRLCGARIVWDGCGIGKVRVECSSDNRTWTATETPVREASEPQSVKWEHHHSRVNGTLWLHYFAFDAKGRYVRVTVLAPPDGQPVGLRELEVYGSANK